MSRRYGRNQKRKAQARIADLESKLLEATSDRDWLRIAVDDLSDRLNFQRKQTCDLLDSLRFHVNQYSTAAPAEVHPHSTDVGDVIRVLISERRATVTRDTLRATNCKLAQDLHRVRMYVERDPEIFNRSALHVRVVRRNGTIGYYLSFDASLDAPFVLKELLERARVTFVDWAEREKRAEVEGREP